MNVAMASWMIFAVWASTLLVALSRIMISRLAMMVRVMVSSLGDGLRQADLMISSGVKVWAKVTSVTSGMSFVRSMVA